MRRKKAAQPWKLQNAAILLCIIISITFLITQIIFLLQLTNVQVPNQSTTKHTSPKIGKFGESLITMLAEDLKFTIFLPSDNAIDRDLRLKSNDSNSYAVLTQVLAFSAVPRWICARDLEYSKEMVYDSISGFKLYVYKDLKGMVVVNGVVAEEVDLKIGNVIVHVMDGVVMDSEFEESMLPDQDDDDEHSEN